MERCVKLVTEAFTAVCGFNARDGYVRCKMTSRTALFLFLTKKIIFKSFKCKKKMRASTMESEQLELDMQLLPYGELWVNFFK